MDFTKYTTSKNDLNFDKVIVVNLNKFSTLHTLKYFAYKWCVVSIEDANLKKKSGKFCHNALIHGPLYLGALSYC